MSQKKIAETQVWENLEKQASRMQDTQLFDLFNCDGERLDKTTLHTLGITFDYSKTHIDDRVMQALCDLADARDFDAARTALLSGGIVNKTENRPALHAALRGSGPRPMHINGSDIHSEVADQKAKMYAFADDVRSGKVRSESGNTYKHIICLGIGGSSLGPDMLLDTLSRAHDSAFDMHIVSNIDAHALVPVFKICDPKRTLLVVASKTFTTIETLVNARSVMAWLSAGGVKHVVQQMAALTAAPEKASEFGISDNHILPFAEWVGGRYSMWSSVGFPAVVAFGCDVFEDLLHGAQAMDAHFATADKHENMPFIAAVIDVWYATFMGAETRAQFVYDERLGLLPDYLQQLEMESNGKNVTDDGMALSWATSPILWGGVGTDGQHAVFQLLHQGTHLTPVEFIAVIKADHDMHVHHEWLLANCFAQGAALMAGRSSEEAAAELPDDAPASLALAKSFTGNRPSTTLLLDELTPFTLGVLVAFFEHRTFVAGTLWGVNVYDQMGVELGKILASGVHKQMTSDQTSPQELTAYDPSTQALIKRAMGLRDREVVQKTGRVQK